MMSPDNDKIHEAVDENIEQLTRILMNPASCVKYVNRGMILLDGEFYRWGLVIENIEDPGESDDVRQM